MSSGEHEGRFSKDPLPHFSAGGPGEQFWHGQGCPLLDVVHPAFLLPTTLSSTLQGALKNGFGEAVVVCDMPEPCNFPSRIACEAFSLLLRLAKSVVNIHHYPAHCMQTLPQNIHRSYQIALFCGRSSCSLTRPSKIT